MIITIQEYKNDPKYHTRLEVEMPDGTSSYDALSAAVNLLAMLYGRETMEEAILDLAEEIKPKTK